MMTQRVQKNLYENLLPQYQAEFLRQEKLHPNLHISVVKSLKSKYYWNELTLFEAVQLIQLLNVPFEIKLINNLFEYSKT